MVLGMQSTLKVNLALFMTIILWASAFVGIRIGLTAYSPGALGLLRFLVASACMAVIYNRMCLLTRMPWSDRLQLLALGIAGIGLYNVCLNYGEITVSAGMASFIIGLMPVITIVMSMLFFDEQQGRAVWFGIVISLSGLFLMTLGEHSQHSMVVGVMEILVSAFMGAMYTLMSRRFLKRYHPVAVTAWVMWGGTLMLMMFLPDLLREIAVARLESTLAVVYMGVFPAALAYVAWSYVLNHFSASRASMYLYALPLVSTLMGYFFLHEVPGKLSMIGGIIALAGAIIANRFRGQTQKTVYS